MAKKKPIAGLFEVADVPCIRTGKTDHVAKVEIGSYMLPLHISEIWKELESADNKARKEMNNDREQRAGKATDSSGSS